MTSKIVALLVVVACPALAHAETRVNATAMIETEDAVWFSTETQPDIVYYFGKTYTAFEEFSPPTGRRRFRVQERLRSVTPPADLGTLHASWSGRQALPFTVVAEESCSLERTQEMMLVAQQADPKGRSFPGNATVAVCQFSFNLPRDIGDDYVADLMAQAEQGTLLMVPLSLDFAVLGALPWADLYDALIGLGNINDSTLSRQDAAVLIGWALIAAPDARPLGYMRLSTAQRDAFVEAALAALFTKVPGGYQVASTSPAGEFTGWATEVTVEL